MDKNKKTILESLYNRLKLIFSETVTVSDETGEEVKVQTETGTIESGDMVVTPEVEGTVVIPDEQKEITVDENGVVTDVAVIPSEEVKTELQEEVAAVTEPVEVDEEAKMISELTAKVAELGTMLKEVLDLIASQNADIEMVKEQPVRENFSSVAPESATEIRKNKIKAIQEYYKNK